jgi:hypothetical protein
MPAVGDVRIFKDWNISPKNHEVDRCLREMRRGWQGVSIRSLPQRQLFLLDMSLEILVNFAFGDVVNNFDWPLRGTEMALIRLAWGQVPGVACLGLLPP